MYSTYCSNCNWCYIWIICLIYYVRLNRINYIRRNVLICKCFIILIWKNHISVRCIARKMCYKMSLWIRYTLLKLNLCPYCKCICKRINSASVCSSCRNNSWTTANNLKYYFRRIPIIHLYDSIWTNLTCWIIRCFNKKLITLTGIGCYGN